MEEKEIKIIYKVWTFDEMNGTDQTLIEQAREATKNAYAPYSEFYVGCAIQLKNGKTITGSNQENAAYPSGLCAERTTIFHVGHQYPNEQISTIAVASKSIRWENTNPVIPCGACVQAMMEYEHKQKNPIRMLLIGNNNTIIELQGLKALMPFQFDLKSTQ